MNQPVYGMAIPDSVAYGALSHAKGYNSKKLDPSDGQVFCTSQVSGKLQHNRWWMDHMVGRGQESSYSFSLHIPCHVGNKHHLPLNEHSL